MLPNLGARSGFPRVLSAPLKNAFLPFSCSSVRPCGVMFIAERATHLARGELAEGVVGHGEREVGLGLRRAAVHATPVLDVDRPHGLARVGVRDVELEHGVRLRARVRRRPEAAGRRTLAVCAVVSSGVKASKRWLSLSSASEDCAGCAERGREREGAKRAP
jgi:hypothetical protein